MPEKSADPIDIDKTLVVDTNSAPSGERHRLLSEELLSARRPPNPLAALFYETLESLSGDPPSITFALDTPEAAAQKIDTLSAEELSCSHPADNYQLKDLISEGGQGTINRAWDQQFQREVAVKTLLDKNTDPALRHTFFTEAKITAQLQHPSIVPIHCLWIDDDDHPHLAMKYIQGNTLRQRLETLRKRYDEMSWRKIAAAERLMHKERLRIFIKICEAIAYAHNHRIIHRDLKPENIMLGHFGQTYVMDWGLATEVLPDDFTIHSDICGTPRYIAPEVLNKKPYGQSADIYQLGLILFELVYLRRAYPYKDINEAMIAGQAGAMAPAIHLYGCRVNTLLQAVVRKATAFDPAERYQSVRELIDDIKGCLNNTPVSVDKYPRCSALIRLLMRHSRLLMATWGILVAVILGLISWNLLRDLQQERSEQLRESALMQVYAHNLRNLLKVERDFFALESQLAVLGREVETRLSSLPAIPEKKRFYDYRSGKNPATAPPGYFFARGKGANISLEVFAYKLPGDKPILDLDRYLSAFAPMLGSFQKILTAYWPDEDDRKKKLLILSQDFMPLRAVFVGLSNGLHIEYPYTDAFSPDFDPRRRPWYRAVKKLKKRQVVWSPPYRDKDSGTITISAGYPLFDQSGGLMGVLGVDLIPNTLIRAFSAANVNSQSSLGRYLIDPQGKVIASDSNLAPRLKNGRIELQTFHYPDYLEMMWKLRTGRIFVDAEQQRLLIFHYIDTLNYIFAEEVDLGWMMQ